MPLTESRVSMMLPISDADRAQKFYTDQLGLPYEGVNDEKALLYRLPGDAQLVLLPRPGERPLASTTMSFEVADLEHEMAELEGRGVTFEDYDTPELRTEGHVAATAHERAAWFLDPDGNVLCLHQTL